MNGTAWLPGARNFPPSAVADRLGLRVHPDVKSFGPCPSCGRERRSSEDTEKAGTVDRRGACAITVSKHGNPNFRYFTNGCGGCGFSGDVINLAAVVLTGKPWAKGDREVGSKFIKFLAGIGVSEANGPAPMAHRAGLDAVFGPKFCEANALPDAGQPATPRTVDGAAEPSLAAVQILIAYLTTLPPGVRAGVKAPGISRRCGPDGQFTAYAAAIILAARSLAPLNPHQAQNDAALSPPKPLDFRFPAHHDADFEVDDHE